MAERMVPNSVQWLDKYSAAMKARYSVIVLAGKKVGMMASLREEKLVEKLAAKRELMMVALLEDGVVAL